MSAILETEPGDEFVCIEAFSVLPKDVADRTKARRNFRIGERVRYERRTLPSGNRMLGRARLRPSLRARLGRSLALPNSKTNAVMLDALSDGPWFSCRSTPTLTLPLKG